MNDLNIGCGRSSTPNWKNYDNSLCIPLRKFPIIIRILRFFGVLSSSSIEFLEWLKSNEVFFLDATKRLPFLSSTVDNIYTSHMIEHLSRSGLVYFLKKAHRILKDGAVLRIVAPDLRLHIKSYLISNDADRFMEKIGVSDGEFNSMRNRIKLLILGFRDHQWMYDTKSISILLKKAGFKNIKILNPGKTFIKDPTGINLFERESESLYMEAIK